MTRNGEVSKTIGLQRSKPLFGWNELRWLFHISFCLYFLRIVVWTISPESAMRPTRQQFGGYYRYFTVCVFSFQVFQLIASTLVDLTPYGKKLKLKRNADDLACAVFCLANTVTLLYYTIESLIPGGILSKASGQSIMWINITHHVVNSIVAWVDIMICHPRRFSPRSFYMVAGFSIGYGIWMQIIRFETGKYPYGFLNLLPVPFGLLAIVPVAAVVLLSFFMIGRKLSMLTKDLMRPDPLEDLDSISSTLTKKQDGKLSDAEEINALKLD